MIGNLAEARGRQAEAALAETDGPGLFHYDAYHITSGQGLDEHLETHPDLRAAMVLYVGQGAVIGVTEAYVEFGDEDDELPVTAKRLYAGTVGRAQGALRSIVPADSEEYGDFRTQLRYGVADSVEKDGFTLLGAHLVQTTRNGDVRDAHDVLMYPERVGEWVAQQYPSAFDTLAATLSVAERDAAALTLGYDLEEAARVSTLVAAMMPTPPEMSRIVNAFHQG